MSPVTNAQKPENRLQQSVELGTLLACYGGLLTDKQREALRLHCNEDCSLAEIAEEMGVSRQNVHELIARSEQKLRRFEKALHLAARSVQTRAALTAALAALEAGQAQQGADTLRQLMEILDEEDAPDGV